MRRVILATVFALPALSPAAAQLSVGVGIEFGGPAYDSRPPVFLYEQPPTYYAPAPPPVVYEQQEIPSAVPPNVVFDKLEEVGYRELGPMAFRDGVYKLSAVNRHGEFVALEISVLSGEVEIETIIGRREAAIPPIPPPASAAPVSPEIEPGRDPLVVY